MTSLYPVELGLVCAETACRTAKLDEHRVTLAESLQEADYTTASFTTNPWLSAARGFCQGFDICVPYHFQKPYELPFLQYTSLLLPLQRQFPALGRMFTQLHRALFDPNLYSAGWEINARALQFLAQYQEQRFFLWLHYVEPHATYAPTTPFYPLAAEVEEFWLEWERANWLGDTNDQKVLSEQDIEALRSLYAGEVQDVDYLVGKILETLNDLGLTDRTVVIITSDHGEEFFEHGDFSHGQSLYTELVHVPLIIAGPMFPQPGLRVKDVVSMLDLLPTLAEIGGGSIPQEAHGRSLLPFMHGEQLPPRAAFSESINGRRPHEYKLIRFQDYSLIYNTKLGELELYDHAQDPHEQNNLATLYTETSRELFAGLDTWILETAILATELETSSLQVDTDEQTEDALRNLGY